MEKMTTYQQLIKQLLTAYAQIARRADKPGEETLTVFDDEGGHYLLHTVGWVDRQHIWYMYVRIHNNKFYIEIDWTEEGIASELLAAGVPKADIVLAFHLVVRLVIALIGKFAFAPALRQSTLANELPRLFRQTLSIVC